MRLTSIISRLANFIRSSFLTARKSQFRISRLRLARARAGRMFQRLEPRQMLAGDVGVEVFSATFDDTGVADGTFQLVPNASGFAATAQSFEIQHNHSQVNSPGNTTPYVELDGTSGMTTQVTTVAGRSYVLQLDYSPRPGVDAEQNEIEVWWNGNVVQRLSRNGNGRAQTSFSQLQFNLPAASSDSTTLEFRSVSQRDRVGLGGLLDNISVFDRAVSPVINSIADQPVATDATLQQTVSLVEEIAGTQYTIDNGPSGLQLDPDTGELAWIANSQNISASDAANSVEIRGPLETVFTAGFEDVAVPEGQFLLVNSTSGFTSITSAPVELQNNHRLVGPAPQGNNLLELDGVNGVATTIGTTTGNEYVISFQYSPRPQTGTTGNSLEIFWDGNLIETIADEGNALSRVSFRTITVDLGVFTGDTTRLEFRSNDPADRIGMGGLIDNVRVSSRTVTTNTGTDGEYQVIVKATTPGGQSSTGSFFITIDDSGSSTAPVVNNRVSDASATLNTAFSFTVPSNTFSDPGGDTLTLSASGLPDWLSFDPSTGEFSGTPGPNDAGTSTVTVTATDPGGESASDSFDIVVGADTNNAPTIGDGIPARNASVANPFSQTVPDSAFQDADGDTLTLSAANLPSWLSFDPATRTFNGTPESGDIDRLSITVTATDPSGATVDSDFVLGVNQFNNAPTEGQGIGNQSATAGTAFSVVVPDDAFADADGDPLTFSTGTLPDWLSFDSTTRMFAGTPAAGDAGTDTILVVVTDPAGGTGDTIFDIAVDGGVENRAPVEDAGIPGQFVSPGNVFNFVVSGNAFSDPDNDSLTLSTNTLPAWLSFDNSTNTFSGTPGVDDIALVTVVVTATDPGGLQATSNFVIDVDNPSNTAPVANATIDNQPATVGSLFSFAVPSDTFVDGDGDILTITSFGTPDWLSFDDTSNTFTGTPSQGDEGAVTIILRATDPSGASATTNLVVDVAGSNAGPAIDQGISNQSATVAADFRFIVPAGAFSDADGDRLALTTSTLPAWLSFDSTNDTFSGTPGLVDIGTETIVVTATDPAGASILDSFEIVISNIVNSAPSVDRGIGQQIAQIPEAFSFTVPPDAFADADGDALTLSTSTLPGWLSFDPTTNTFSGTPMLGDGGTEPVTVTATDPDGANVQTTFNIQVLAENVDPRVDAPIADQAATVNGGFAFAIPAGTFVDPNPQDVLTLSTNTLPAWLTFDPSTASFSGTPGSGDVGTVTVNVTATDGDGASVTDAFDIMVSGSTTNTAPNIDQGIGQQIAQIPEAFSFTVPPDAFADADGDTLTLSTSILPGWLSFDPSTNTFSGTPMAGDGGTEPVTVTATDPDGANVQTTFNVQVLAENVAPRVDAPIADQAATVDTGFAYAIPAGTFVDPNPEDVLTFSTNDLPAWLTFDPSTASFSGTPGSGDVGTVTVNVTATDGDGAFVTDAFDIEVSGSTTNTAPNIDQGIGQQIAQIPEAFSFTVPPDAFADADGDALTLSTSTLPGWLSFDPTTNTFSGTPMLGDGGTEPVTVTATDPDGANVQTTFNVQVLAENVAPRVDAPIADQAATVNGGFAFAIPAGTFVDPNPQDVLTLSTNTLPAWLTFDPSTASFSGTPGSGDVGTVTVNVTATDGDGAFVTDAFDIEVSGSTTNTAPNIDQGIGQQIAQIPEAFSFTVPPDAFADADGDALTLSTSTLPGWLSFDPTTNTFSGTPMLGDGGTEPVTVTATDPDGANVQTTFNIQVLAENVDPRVDAPIADQAATVNGGFAFAIPAGTFVDPNPQDVLTLSTNTLPAWLTFDPSTASFSGTPGSGDVGTVTVNVTATDGDGAFVTDAFDIEVSGSTTNTAPNIDQGIGQQIAQIPEAFSFTVPPDAFADADGDALTLSTSTLPGWLSFDPSTNTFSGTPMAGDGGTEPVTVTATDPDGANVQTTFNVQVLAENVAPRVDAPIADQAATVDTGFAYAIPAGTFVDPNPEDVLTFSTNDLSAWLTFDPSTASFSGTPGSGDVGTVTVNVTATDGDGASVTDAFDIMVSGSTTNTAPNIDQGIGQQIAQIPEAFSFTVPSDAFADADGDALTLSTSTLPGWLSFDPSTNTFSGTPMAGDGGTEPVTVTATDPDGANVQTTFNVQVLAENVAPRVDAPIADQAATVDTGFAYAIPAGTFVDPNPEDVLTFSTNDLPAWLTFDPSTASFSGTPGSGDVGTVTVNVTATDGDSASISDVFDIVVSDSTPNTAPNIDQGIGQQIAQIPEAFSFTVPPDAFADADNDTLSLSTSTLPGWLSFDPSTNTFSGTPMLGDGGTEPVTVTATDPGGANVQTTFNVQVLAENVAPTVDEGIVDQTATSGEVFSFVVPFNAFSDANTGDSLTLSAVGGPAWVSFDDSTNTFTGTPDASDIGNITTIVVTATDPSGASASDSFAVTVVSGSGPALTVGLRKDTGDSGSDLITSDPTLAGQIGMAVQINSFTASVPGEDPVNLTGFLNVNREFTIPPETLALINGSTALSEGLNQFFIELNGTSTPVEFTYDTVAPNIIAGPDVTAEAGSDEFTIEFSEDAGDDSLDDLLYSLTSGGEPVGIFDVVRIDGDTILVVLDDPLTAGKSYTLAIDPGLSDVAGNLTDSATTFDFTPA